MFVGNVATNFGGAVYNNSILINCQFRNNSAAEGGAAKSCGLLNCLIVSNQASVNGGGTATCQMTNCTITANSAGNSGGGFYQGSGTRNCIVYFNSAPSSPNFTPSSILNTCTLPLPPLVGGNNITNAPLFVDQAAGNFHLQTSSPCINAGYNGFVLGNTDLDGNPRIAGGIVDMGAYEFQNPTSVLPYAWLQQFGLPIDGSVDFVDTDADGLNNWQEWRALTDPTNAASVLKLAVSQTEAGILLQWPSGIGRKYFVERSSNLLDQPAFQIIQSDISAVSTTTSFTDVEAVGPGPFFYRVGVQY
jgi:hypothetical protein